MTHDQFHNALRIMLNIDMSCLVNNGVIASDDTAQWQTFRADPYRWFIKADPHQTEALYAIIESRQTPALKHVRPVAVDDRREWTDPIEPGDTVWLNADLPIKDHPAGHKIDAGSEGIVVKSEGDKLWAVQFGRWTIMVDEQRLTTERPQRWDEIHPSQR